MQTHLQVCIVTLLDLCRINVALLYHCCKTLSQMNWIWCGWYVTIIPKQWMQIATVYDHYSLTGFFSCIKMAK